MSCSRTQCSDAGEAWTSGPSDLSQALYHWATVLPMVGKGLKDLGHFTFFIGGDIWNVGQQRSALQMLVQSFASPDWDPNCLTLWLCPWKKIFLKSKFWKKVSRRQQKHEKLPSMQRVLKLGSQVIDKGFFSEAFLFKPRGGRSGPSGLNRKPRKNPLFSFSMAQAQINTCYWHLAKFTFAPPSIQPKLSIILHLPSG